MEAHMRRSCRRKENAARLLTIPGVGPGARLDGPDGFDNRRANQRANKRY